jgi:arylsulfatase A-like enzyme
VGERDPIWAIRKGDWKLIKHRELLFLSDMSKDVTETDNLAVKYPEKVKELMKLYEDMKR